MSRSRDEFFRALSGRTGADPTGQAGTGLTGQLLAAFGASRRDPSKPNTAAAAKALGVTQRTVQRWLADATQQHQRPRQETMKKIATRSRQAATTRRGRQRSTAALTAKVSQTGMRLNLTGTQGPEQGPGYERRRTVPLDFPPDLAAAFMSAYETGGDAAARAFISRHAVELYSIGSWHIGDDWASHPKDRIEISGLYGID